MSLLRLFLMGWLSVGIVVLAFLFWLCKHTPIKEVDSFPILKPSRARLAPRNCAMAFRSYRKYCRKSRALREYNFCPNGKSEKQRCT
jgi:hypothetical protein